MQEIDALVFLHEGGLAHELRLLFARPLMAAGSRFVMNQVRIRRPDILETGSLQPQTKVHVVETDREIFSSNPPASSKTLSPHEQARARYRGAILLQQCAIKITRMTVRHARKAHDRRLHPAQNHSAVLKRSIRIPKSRADRADFRAHHMAHHFAQPAGFVRFDIVVEKCEHLPSGGSRAAS